MNKNKLITLNDINDVIDIFEDFLNDYDVKITASDKEKIEDGIYNNAILFYGTVYSDIQNRLLNYFEILSDEGKIVDVVNSWDDEVDSWGDENN